MANLTPLKRLLAIIDELATNPSISFDQKTEEIKAFVEELTDNDLKYLLGEAGFIPEAYEADSSEEKVYAKAMDILVAESLRRVAYVCEVSQERSNSADVVAVCNAGTVHELVLDAKAFRLTRTALNPKDYKIEALNTWRKTAHFACLVAPLGGFPTGTSRLYKEAIRFNVTLLTFSHLQFILENGLPAPDALHPLWGISSELRNSLPSNPTAENYWAAVDRRFCELLAADIQEWKTERHKYFSAMLAVADEQVEYFENLRKQILGLSREKLIPLAIKALRIDAKIEVIKDKKTKALSLLKSIERTER